jgi:hypothetical protein
MTSESLSLFYEEQRATSAEPRAERASAPRPPTNNDAIRRMVARWAAPAPELAPGQGGCPHVGRVESTTDGIVSVAYGPRPHRETCPAADLTPITDKDGEGRLR